MTKIVANIIGRNESNNYLDRVLNRLTKQVDLITFTDDCSDDDTAEKAASHGAKVFKMPQPTFAIHEGRLRQASWDHLERHITYDEPWWVLAIDCDEMLYETKYTLRDITLLEDIDLAFVQFYHMWNDKQFRVDKAWRPHPSTRYFKYMVGGRFNNKQLACGSEPTYVMDSLKAGRCFYQSGLIMKHLSYINDDDKKTKYERYAKIDGGAFHANAHIESILDPDPVLDEWMWSGGGPE